MKINRSYNKFKTTLTLIASLTIVSQCTDNPFDQNDNNKIIDHHVLQGTLSLSDTASKSDIFIWLAGAGISTFSDSRGSFRLQLPNTAEIRGLNGVFGLYYYLGNYRIDSSQVLIRDGVFEYGKSDINDDGKIINAPTLKKLLDIRTSVSPAETVSNESFILFVTVELKAFLEPVFVGTLKDREEALTSMIFLKKNADILESKLYGDPYSPATVEAVSVGLGSIWEGKLFIPANYFEPDEYLVVPYIQIIQENIPEELLLSLGEQVHELSYDYLNIPFKQTAAVLQITSN